MTKEDALSQAARKSYMTRARWLVIHRPDHPALGDYHYAICASYKSRWLASETLVATYESDGRRT